VNYSQTTDTGNTINNVEYSNIGIIVDVIPHINPDGLVLLDVAPQISSLTTSNVQVASNLTAPIYNVRSAQSEVAIRDGQTIVIGGLMQDQKNSTIDKVPVLGDLPWVGQAFQHRNEVKTKTELLIFLTPHVARQPDLLKGMSDDELRNTKLVPGAVYPGAFDEHRRGLERGVAPTTMPMSNIDAIPGSSAQPTTQPAQNDPFQVQK
jgi:general secretion pathway protein D